MSIESLHITYSELLGSLFDIMPITYLTINDMGDANGQQVSAYGGVQDVDDYIVLAGIASTASGITNDPDILRKLFTHYLYYIAKEKPFLVHNSRTGALSALYFLENNGRTWNGDPEVLANIARKAELDSDYTWADAYWDVVACGRETIS